MCRHRARRKQPCRPRRSHHRFVPPHPRLTRRLPLPRPHSHSIRRYQPHHRPRSIRRCQPHHPSRSIHRCQPVRHLCAIRRCCPPRPRPKPLRHCSPSRRWPQRHPQAVHRDCYRPTRMHRAHRRSTSTSYCRRRSGTAQPPTPASDHDSKRQGRAHCARDTSGLAVGGLAPAARHFLEARTDGRSSCDAQSSAAGWEAREMTPREDTREPGAAGLESGRGRSIRWRRLRPGA